MCNTAILFTGKILPESFSELVELTKNITYKVASIWENENTQYIETLIANNFTIIKNDLNQQKLFTCQFIPIVNGLKWIKDNGFDYVLRTRFDVITSDYIKYLEIIKELNADKITVLSGIETGNEIYFLDIITYGNIKNMSRFYMFQSVDDGRYIEKYLLENYSNKLNLTRNNINEILNFSLKACIDNNIEFIWYRPHSWSSPLVTTPRMRVINEYCKQSFIWV